MVILFDRDGFFNPNNTNTNHTSLEHKFISVDDAPQNPFNLFEQYYLGFRCAMFICEDTVEDEHEAKNALKLYHKGCLGDASRCVENHINSRPVLPADFMWIIRNEIVNELKKEYPEAANIKLRLSMQPRLSARIVDENNIIFPALARSVMNHCNLMIINSIYEIISDDGKLTGNPDRRELARFILPYLLYCHDDFSVRNLPIISAYSYESLSTAFRLTNIQMMFIFAHEYGHILLKHFKNKKKSCFIDNIENEADIFALNTIIRYAENSKLYSKVDIFTAIRWLFKFQLIEESIGILIQGGTLDYPNSKFEERRAKLQADIFKNDHFEGSTLIDIIGFCMIVELQDLLYEFGSEFINNIINAFNKSGKTGEVEPWWEKITNK